MCGNGLVANVSCGGSNWLDYINSAIIPAMRPTTNAKSQGLLKKLKDSNRLIVRLYDLPGLSNSYDWTSLILNAHSQFPFDLMIFDAIPKSTYVGDSAVEFPNLEGTKWDQIKGKRDRTLQKNKQKFEEHLAPLLRYTRTLAIIDPYANPYEDRYKIPLMLISSLLGKGLTDSRTRTICIHADNKPWGKKDEMKSEGPVSRLSGWKSFLEELYKQYPYQYEVKLWKQKAYNPDKFHDRFILTDQFGVQIPSGFDCFPEGSQATWNLLDNDERNLWHRNFNNKPKYERHTAHSISVPEKKGNNG